VIGRRKYLSVYVSGDLLEWSWASNFDYLVDGAADLGGSVDIDSSPGRGTRVLARIPLEAPAAETAASAEGPTSRETASQASQQAVSPASQESISPTPQGKEEE